MILLFILMIDGFEEESTLEEFDKNLSLDDIEPKIEEWKNITIVSSVLELRLL